MSFGVGAAGEVVAAEVVVGDVVFEDVVAGDQDRVGDGDDRFLVSAAAFDLLVLGAQVGVLGADGGVGGLDQRGAAGSGLPLRVVLIGACRRIRRCRGRSPSSWRHVDRTAKRVMSGPSSARITCAAAGGDTRDRCQQLRLVRERDQPLLDLRGQRRDRLVQIVDVREDLRDDQRVVRFEVARERLPQRRQLLAQCAPCELGQNLGSRVPDTSASSISRPDTPSTSVATQDSLTPASSSTLCSRFASRARSWISDLRYRVSSRNSRIGFGGTKLERSSPHSNSWHSHCESLHVGLAPGDNQHHRLHELRSPLPEEVTVTHAFHPLCGQRLAVEGRRRVGGTPCLIVRLPDGTPGTIAVQATSAGAAEQGGRGCDRAAGGALLSAEGVRRLRLLLAPRGASGEGSGT